MRIGILTISLLLFLTPVNGNAFGAEHTDETRSDLWLKSKLVTAYTLNEYLNPFELEVEIENGVAFINGTVDSPAERDLALEIAKGVEGIREVRGNILVKPGTLENARAEDEFFRVVEDATITAKVKSKLLWNKNTHGLNIDVSTRKGVVTLTGTAASGVHRDLAEQLAKNTTGVERVRNHLRVDPEQKTNNMEKSLETFESKVSDAWVTARVKSTLLFSTEADGADIRVSTRDHVVTLEGTVASRNQQQEIVTMVGNIVGVDNVRSQLKVEKQ
ncbi:MAG: BON domain-containing protein [Syntrophotaleaceae bacterium]